MHACCWEGTPSMQVVQLHPFRVEGIGLELGLELGFEFGFELGLGVGVGLGGWVRGRGSPPCIRSNRIPFGCSSSCHQQDQFHHTDPGGKLRPLRLGCNRANHQLCHCTDDATTLKANFDHFVLAAIVVNCVTLTLNTTPDWSEFLFIARGPFFRQNFTLEDAIKIHTFAPPLEALAFV
jgi:hypothetical protein